MSSTPLHPSRSLKLFLFPNGAGAHLAGWRHPQARADILSVDFVRELVQIAEAARFHAIFYADGLSGPSGVRSERGARAGYEPFTLLSALSVLSSRIGLVGTASTTYNEPYHVARKFASLDLLSGGRAAWNVVTSTSNAEAASFGRDVHLDHDVRYERAEEFVDAVRALWDSWDEDVFLYDKASGRYLDASRLHGVDYRGSHVATRGTLNVPRPAQGHPVLVQAGSSGEGRRLAARIADVMFTTQADLADAQAFYAETKKQVSGFGRDPDSFFIMPGLSVILGRSREHALHRLRELSELVDIHQAVEFLGAISGGVDFSGHALDGPVPEFPLGNGNRSKQVLFLQQARSRGLTIRELALEVAASGGHRVVAGTPAEVADDIAAWFQGGAADGFNFKPLYHTENLSEFAQQVIPVLQERGLFHADYAGTTLRENLGLAAVPSPHAQQAAVAASEVHA